MQVSGENYNYIENGTEVKVVQTECWCQTEKLNIQLSFTRDPYHGEVCITMQNIQWPLKQRWRQFLENRWERSVLLNQEEFLDFVAKLNELKDFVINNEIKLRKFDEEDTEE